MDLLLKLIIGGLILISIMGVAIYFLVKNNKSDGSPPAWRIGGWSPSDEDCAEKNCGTCDQRRPVTCVQGDTVVADSECSQPKPTAAKTAPSPPCEYDWSEGGAWDTSQCDGKVCGTFYETKKGVFCEDQFKRAVTDSLCTAPKVDKKPCENLEPCEYEWRMTPWNVPVDWKCDTGTATRQIGCYRKNDSTLADYSYCPTPAPPTTRFYPDKTNYPDDPDPKPCTNGWLATTGWNPADPSQCKTIAPCGQGQQKRGVGCFKDGAILQNPDPAICPEASKLASTQACDTGISCDCCPSAGQPASPDYCKCDWVKGPIGTCPPFWNTILNAQVDCKNQDRTKVVDASNCKNIKPNSFIECNPGNPTFKDNVMTIFNPSSLTKISGENFEIDSLLIPVRGIINKIEIPYMGEPQYTPNLAILLDPETGINLTGHVLTPGIMTFTVDSTFGTGIIDPTIPIHFRILFPMTVVPLEMCNYANTDLAVDGTVYKGKCIPMKIYLTV